MEPVLSQFCDQVLYLKHNLKAAAIGSLRGTADTIQGDLQRLSQAIRNLVINAIQAMPRGGKLRIKAEKHDNSLLLTLADSGPGFSEAALARGTELFYTEKEGGMGVGLNIVASIIEAHGGCLSLQNDPKGGAIVSVSLPSPT